MKAVLLFLICCFGFCLSLHVKGTWNNKHFLNVLAKFGFQKTIENNPNTRGYIFGNITIDNTNITNYHYVTLTVLDHEYFQDFYKYRSHHKDMNKRCQKMFKKISKIAFDSVCFENGQEDFLRKIPCKSGSICPDEDNPLGLVKDHQFTFTIEDITQPRFWYVSLVSCYLEPINCNWQHSSDEYDINYDIWLVNGNPNTRQQNPLEYQFSFDKMDTVEMYLAFCVLYLILGPLQTYASIKQKHTVTLLLTTAIWLEFLAMFFNLIHVLQFAFNGVGIEALSMLGDVLDILGRTVLMLLLLLLAQGWAVTHIKIPWTPVMFTIWGLYAVANIGLYFWHRSDVELDVYETWGEWLAVCLRVVITVWFLWEVRRTISREQDPNKLSFLLHFAASALVWFIYKPILKCLLLPVSILWRDKVHLGITYSADFLALAVLVHLLWPSRSRNYLLLRSDGDVTDELEEFNENVHNLARKSRPVFVRDGAIST